MVVCTMVSLVGVYDIVWLFVAIAYQIAFLTIPILHLVENNMPPASSVIVTCEQVCQLLLSLNREFLCSCICKDTCKHRDCSTKEARKNYSIIFF